MSLVITKIEKNGVAWLILNRPERLNALNYALADAIIEAIERLDQDETVRVIVLKGAYLATEVYENQSLL